MFMCTAEDNNDDRKIFQCDNVETDKHHFFLSKIFVFTRLVDSDLLRQIKVLIIVIKLNFYFIFIHPVK